jgi:type II secretory pathway pseudopilin PulG
MASNCNCGGCAQRGFAYVEVLLSVLLLSVLLAPALQALGTGIAGGGTNLAARQFALRSKMEEVLATPFGDLYAETYQFGGNTATSLSSANSDPVGTVERILVVLYRYDIATNALSSSDTGLIYVNTYYESEGASSGLSTLIGRWW